MYINEIVKLKEMTLQLNVDLKCSSFEISLVVSEILNSKRFLTESVAMQICFRRFKRDESLESYCPLFSLKMFWTNTV